MALLNNEKYSLFYQRLGVIYQRPEVKASLEVILSVFTVTLLIFAAIRPTLTNVAALQKKIEDLEVVNKKADKKIAQVFAAQNDLEKYGSKLALFDLAVPSTFSYSDMVGRIVFLAKRSGLTVLSVDMPGNKIFGAGKPVGELSQRLVGKSANKIVQAKISFVVSGGPENSKKFLVEMENLDRLSMLDNVVMTTNSNPLNKGAMTIKVSGQIYFYFYQDT